MERLIDRLRRVLCENGRLVSLDNVPERNLIHMLTMLTHDTDELVRQRACWELAEIVSRMQPERIETRLRRLTWRLNPESGDYPVGLPELLGEIGNRAPGQIRIFVPHILYYLDDETLRPGLLQAAGRIGENLPETLTEHVEEISACLRDNNPIAAGNAALALRRIGGEKAESVLQIVKTDPRQISLFHGGAFMTIKICDIVEGDFHSTDHLCFITTCNSQ
jgi:hypothetical protein